MVTSSRIVAPPMTGALGRDLILRRGLYLAIRAPSQSARTYAIGTGKDDPPTERAMLPGAIHPLVNPAVLQLRTSALIHTIPELAPHSLALLATAQRRPAASNRRRSLVWLTLSRDQHPTTKRRRLGAFGDTIFSEFADASQG